MHRMTGLSVAGVIAACATMALAGPAAAATSDSGTQTAAATVANTLSASLPSGSFNVSPTPGSDATSAQSITVRSNAAWGLRIYADHANLTKWDGSAYVPGTELAKPLALSVDGSADADIQQDAGSGATGITNAVVLTDAQAEAAGDTGRDVPATFKQAFSFADAPGDYRAVITYAVDQSF